MKNSEPKINTREIAALSKLSFSQDELTMFEKDMEAIVDFANKISDAVISESFEDTPLTNVLREDKRSESFFEGDLLSAAPDRLDSYIRVVKVVE